jgi:uncharacterized protein YqjF (DUF2071 family)
MGDRSTLVSCAVLELSFRFGGDQEPAPCGARGRSARWLYVAERYHLYTTDGASLYRGDVAHEPWRLRQVTGLRWEDRLSTQFGFDPAIDLRARYAEPLDVHFKPFVKLPKIK